jgi:hypothetical protein
MAATDSTTDQDLIKHVTEHWTELNKTLGDVPKFKNEHQAGVSEERIKEFESKLKIVLPKEIRAAIKVHDGRKHIGYGLIYRLPTTDLLPLTEWRPYEKDNDDFSEDLFGCLADKDNASTDKNLHDDAREHLKAYLEATKKSSKGSDSEAFKSLPCELLIIGQGMDDYAEQYLLSIRSGRIYLAIHNIPEWNLIGSFNDWIKQGLSNVKDQKDELKEQHDEAEVS